MSFIIWYQVEIEEEKSAGGLLGAAAALVGLGLPLKVSNSVFNGAFILDADITITMTGGDNADSFEMTLINLPTTTADLLKAKQKSGMQAKPAMPLTVKIHLGYFDEPSTTGSQPVLEGKITAIKSTIGENGVARTVINGQEKGGYHLRTTRIAVDKPEESTGDAFVKDKIAQPAGVAVADEGKLNLPLPNFTLTAVNGLQALGKLAGMAKSPLVVRDNTIYVGAAVGNPKYPAPVDFTPETNIVSLDEVQENDIDAERSAQSTQDKSPTTTNTRLKLTVLGHPGLRVGQVATIKDVDKAPKDPLRIEQVTHHFSTQNGGGYTCKVTLIVAAAGQPVRTTTGVQSVIDRVRDVVESTQSQRPALDMGQVKEYTPGSQQKHLATLDYGQSVRADGVAPSVETPIDDGVQLHNKPLAAPFAFHKCGLIVPVYPKMRGLIAHNRGLVNDAIIAGFVWAENPLQERPKNEVGDYWLCLPTELDNDGLPTGKGTNDLTDKSGLRVIQVKGLHIVVGEQKLPSIGERPTVPDANTIVIEHQSGTKITIADDGTLKIETSNKDIALTNGSVTMKLSGSAVEVS